MQFKDKKKKARMKKISRFVTQSGKIFIAFYISITVYSILFDTGTFEKIQDIQIIERTNWDEGLTTEAQKQAKLKELNLGGTSKEMNLKKNYCLKEGRKKSANKNPSVIQQCSRFLDTYYAGALTNSIKNCTNSEVNMMQYDNKTFKKHISICLSIRSYAPERNVDDITNHIIYWSKARS